MLQNPTTRVFIGYFPRSTKRRDVEAELSRCAPDWLDGWLAG